MSVGMVLGGCVAGVDNFSYILSKGEGGRALKGGETILFFPVRPLPTRLKR